MAPMTILWPATWPNPFACICSDSSSVIACVSISQSSFRRSFCCLCKSIMNQFVASKTNMLFATPFFQSISIYYISESLNQSIHRKTQGRLQLITSVTQKFDNTPRPHHLITKISTIQQLTMTTINLATICASSHYFQDYLSLREELSKSFLTSKSIQFWIILQSAVRMKEDINFAWEAAPLGYLLFATRVSQSMVTLYFKVIQSIQSFENEGRAPFNTT